MTPRTSGLAASHELVGGWAGAVEEWSNSFGLVKFFRNFFIEGPRELLILYSVQDAQEETYSWKRSAQGTEARRGGRTCSTVTENTGIAW